jgi:hypothetical protein
VIDDVIQKNFLVGNLGETLKGCPIMLAHVLADVAVFVEDFRGNVVFTRVTHLM